MALSLRSQQYWENPISVGKPRKVGPYAQTLVMELCVIILSLIQQILTEYLPNAKYPIRHWGHRGELHRDGLCSQELANDNLERFLKKIN